jgi:hypothetical protein
MRKKYICKTCKGDNVRLDAFAVWDTENQCWELGSIFEQAHCDDCERETTLEEVKAEPSGKEDYHGQVEESFPCMD